MSEVGPLWTSDEIEPRDPVLLLGYAGWSDGGEAATAALRHLLERLSFCTTARIDMEDFVDFTVVRPHVRLGEGGRREIVWPHHEFFVTRLEDRPRDLLVGLGVEPHLHWKRYCQTVVTLVRALGVRTVLLLGAYLDEVIYSQPIEVIGLASDRSRVEKHGLASIDYQGPTGIVGILLGTLEDAGIESMSLWARMPHYVSTVPNWRGALALLQNVERVTGLPLDLSELGVRASEFDDSVSQMIASNPQLSEYVKELKRRAFSS